MGQINKRHRAKTTGLMLDNIINDQSTHGARLADKARAAKFDSPDTSKQLSFKLGTATFYFTSAERLAKFKELHAEEIKANKIKASIITDEIQQP